MDRTPSGQCKCENCANGGGLHNWTEGLVEVHIGTLGEAAQDPACLVPLQGAVGEELVLEDPLARDNICLWRPPDEVPRVVLQKGAVFFLHSSPPIGVDFGRSS